MGVQRGEELGREERPQAVDGQGEPEQRRQRKPAVAEHDQPRGERPLGEAPQGQAHVEEMQGDAHGQEPRRGRQPEQAAEVEVRDHADHGRDEDRELPAGEPLAP
ncbi:MAG: hypothetical protein ACREN5_06820, partial [Gemmatimonadales bacterium]